MHISNSGKGVVFLSTLAALLGWQSIALGQFGLRSRYIGPSAAAVGGRPSPARISGYAFRSNDGRGFYKRPFAGYSRFYPYYGGYGGFTYGSNYNRFGPTYNTYNYYYAPIYQTPGYVPPPVGIAPPPPANDPARLPPPAPLPAPTRAVAYIDIRLPADAKLWVQGVETTQKGPNRRFVSPPLQPGRNYSYEFRVQYEENGKMQTAVQHLSVRAGDRKSLTVIALPAERNKIGEVKIR